MNLVRVGTSTPVAKKRVLSTLLSRSMSPAMCWRRITAGLVKPSTGRRVKSKLVASDDMMARVPSLSIWRSLKKFFSPVFTELSYGGSQQGSIFLRSVKGSTAHILGQTSQIVIGGPQQYTVTCCQATTGSHATEGP